MSPVILFRFSRFVQTNSRSWVFASEEMEATHANMLEVTVEFRAPSIAAAADMIEAHQVRQGRLSAPQFAFCSEVTVLGEASCRDKSNRDRHLTQFPALEHSF